MTTTYAVDVTIAETPEGAHEATCACSCGWTLTASAPSSQLATRISDRARANHFEDEHPDQRRYATQVVAVTRAGHEPALSGSTKDGFGWGRSIVCACGWEIGVEGRTPLEAASLARQQHRRHVLAETDPSQRGDRLVLLGALAVMVTMIVALVAVALNSPLI